jgi:hypothetical protein
MEESADLLLYLCTPNEHYVLKVIAPENKMFFCETHADESGQQLPKLLRLSEALIIIV